MELLFRFFFDGCDNLKGSLSPLLILIDLVVKLAGLKKDRGNEGVSAASASVLLLTDEGNGAGI